MLAKAGTSDPMRAKGPPPRRPLRCPRTPAPPHRAVSAALPCPARGLGDSSSPVVRDWGAGPITPSGRCPARLGDPLKSRPSPQTLEPGGARMPHRPRHQMHPKQTQTPDLLHRPTHLTPHTHLTPLPRPPRFWGNQGGLVQRPEQGCQPSCLKFKITETLMITRFPPTVKSPHPQV